MKKIAIALSLMLAPVPAHAQDQLHATVKALGAECSKLSAAARKEHPVWNDIYQARMGLGYAWQAFDAPAKAARKEPGKDILDDDNFPNVRALRQILVDTMQLVTAFSAIDMSTIGSLGQAQLTRSNFEFIMHSCDVIQRDTAAY